MNDTHISRNWTTDPFAPECGCTLLPCGHVSLREACEKECDQHSIMAMRTIRNSHPEESCKGVNRS